ncbi:terminase small subunit [Pseudoalteromonas umbrosa]|uniref:terminase small subunit n=1 Tax=Pseudoalteromonas umbrosa TaxID=3048489 RepID=UPI0024C46BCF|nr:terminase small subunit [Pseudoalteromonas sp. B95]MDK1289825.1 terminase small subunit [Pseudoalteromonas sp. B95]
MNKVNQAELANLFGVTPKTIREWRDAGMSDLGKEGRSVVYDSRACFNWRVEFEADRTKERFGVNQQEAGSMNMIEAKTRKESAQALLAELELAKTLEQVANIDDLMRNVADALQAVRAKLIGQSNRLSGSLAHQDQEEVCRILDEDADETLKALSDYSHKYVRE